MMFEVDVVASFITVLLGCAIVISSVSGAFSASAAAYSGESRRYALLWVSEALVSTAGYKSSLGLAEYSNNSAKHHLLDRGKLDSLAGMDAAAAARSLGLAGFARVEVSCPGGHWNTSQPAGLGAVEVRRLAYLDGGVCVVQLQAWK